MGGTESKPGGSAAEVHCLVVGSAFSAGKFDLTEISTPAARRSCDDLSVNKWGLLLC